MPRKLLLDLVMFPCNAKNITCFATLSDAKGLRFGLSLWCQIASDSGRAMQAAKIKTLLRRVLRRFFESKGFLEGFLEGARKAFSVHARFLDKVLRSLVRRERCHRRRA